VAAQHVELGEGPPVGRSRTHARGEQMLSHVEWREAPFDWQVKAPCKPCNEGWMEALEGQAREVLPPMLDDTRVVLDAVQQHTLAKWATLRVLMGQHGHPPGMRAIPETNSPDHGEPDRPNAYVVGFTVGYVAFLYWGHEIEDGLQIDLGPLRPSAAGHRPGRLAAAGAARRERPSTRSRDPAATDRLRQRGTADLAWRARLRA
jgi:hypothetical protein